MGAGSQWRRRDRRKLSLAIKKSPGLPAGRAESFPVMGELCLRATSCWLAVMRAPPHAASPDVLRPDPCAACQIFGPFFKSKF